MASVQGGRGLVCVLVRSFLPTWSYFSVCHIFNITRKKLTLTQVWLTHALYAGSPHDSPQSLSTSFWASTFLGAIQITSEQARRKKDSNGFCTLYGNESRLHFCSLPSGILFSDVVPALLSPTRNISEQILLLVHSNLTLFLRIVSEQNWNETLRMTCLCLKENTCVFRILELSSLPWALSLGLACVWLVYVQVCVRAFYFKYWVNFLWTQISNNLWIDMKMSYLF